MSKRRVSEGAMSPKNDIIFTECSRARGISGDIQKSGRKERKRMDGETKNRINQRDSERSITKKPRKNVSSQERELLRHLL